MKSAAARRPALNFFPFPRFFLLPPVRGKSGGPRRGRFWLPALVLALIPPLNLPGSPPPREPVYFSQYDPRWKDEIMGDGKIETYGCLLSSLAIMLSRDIPGIDPSALNRYLRQNSGYTRGNLIVFARIDSYPASSFRFHSREDFSLGAIKSYLDRGWGVIAGFAGGSHWVYVLGYTGGGEALSDYAYHDPGYNGRDQVFSPAQIPVTLRIFSRPGA